MSLLLQPGLFVRLVYSIFSPLIMAFDPSAPYSSSMDDVPLKILFGIKKIKKRPHSSQERSSSKNTVNDVDPVREKVKKLVFPFVEMVFQKHEKGIQSMQQFPDGFAKKPMSKRSQNNESSSTKQEAANGYETNLSPIESKKRKEPSREEYNGRNTNYIQVEGQSNVLCSVIPKKHRSKRLKMDKTKSVAREINPGRDISVRIENLVTEFEAALFEMHGSSGKYREKARYVINRLKANMTFELCCGFLSGKVTPKQLCFMTAKQMASFKVSDDMDVKEEEDVEVPPISDKPERPSTNMSVNSGEHLQEPMETSACVGSKMVKIEGDDEGSNAVLSSKDDVKCLQEMTRASACVSSEMVKMVVNEEESKAVSSYKDVDSIENKVSKEKSLSCPDVILVTSNSVAVPSSVGEDRVINLLPPIEKLSLPAILPSDKSRKDLDARDTEANKNQIQVSTKTSDKLKKVASVELKCESSHVDSYSTCALTERVNKVDDNVQRKNICCSNQNLLLLKNKPEASCSIPEIAEEKHTAPLLEDKLWEGRLQFNAYVTVTATALFKSGMKVQTNSWNELVEIKGRVRLDAFDKFLQELPLSRNRSLMVVSFRCKAGSHESDLTGMQEISNFYKRTERVGYAEACPGVDLYVCPPDEVIFNMLVKYGFNKSTRSRIGKEDILIGCVVWRRNNSTSLKKLTGSVSSGESPSHLAISQSMPPENRCEEKKLGIMVANPASDSDTADGKLDRTVTPTVKALCHKDSSQAHWVKSMPIFGKSESDKTGFHRPDSPQIDQTDTQIGPPLKIDVIEQNLSLQGNVKNQTSERNINAVKLALAGHLLDSPTRDAESKCFQPVSYTSSSTFGADIGTSSSEINGKTEVGLSVFHTSTTDAKKLALAGKLLDSPTHSDESHCQLPKNIVDVEKDSQIHDAQMISLSGSGKLLGDPAALVLNEKPCTKNVNTTTCKGPPHVAVNNQRLYPSSHDNKLQSIQHVRGRSEQESPTRFQLCAEGSDVPKPKPSYRIPLEAPFLERRQYSGDMHSSKFPTQNVQKTEPTITKAKEQETKTSFASQSFDDLPEFDFTAKEEEDDLPEFDFKALTSAPAPAPAPDKQSWKSIQIQQSSSAASAVDSNPKSTSSQKMQSRHGECEKKQQQRQQISITRNPSQSQKHESCTYSSVERTESPCTSQSEAQKGKRKSYSLWDDDDIPEWCPPYPEAKRHLPTTTTNIMISDPPLVPAKVCSPLPRPPVTLPPILPRGPPRPFTPPPPVNSTSPSVRPYVKPDFRPVKPLDTRPTRFF